MSALVALYLVWGSSVPAMKMMVETLPPLAGAGAVFTLGGMILLASARHRIGADSAALRRAATAGAILLVGGQGLGTVALTKMTASLTSIIIATIPLAVAALGWATGMGTSRRIGGCLVAGFVGVAIVVATAPSAAMGGSPGGVALTLFAVACWATGTHLAGRGGLPQDVRVSGGTQLLAGGVLLLLLAAVFGQLAPAEWDDASARSLGAAVFLLVADSLAGFLLYAHLLRRMPVSTVSTYAYATPVIAAGIGFTLLDEPFWWGAVAGGIVVIGAVATQLRSE